MLQIGQFFKKGDSEYGLLDAFQFNGENYYYFSIEKDKKYDYRFYILKSSSETNGYDFELVSDEALNTQLLEMELNRIKDCI